LSYRFVQFDLVGGRVDFEKEITSVDDIAVLETDLSQGAADLRTQLKMSTAENWPRNPSLPSTSRCSGALTTT
jgi:hypothetical protein